MVKAQNKTNKEVSLLGVVKEDLKLVGVKGLDDATIYILTMFWSTCLTAKGLHRVTGGSTPMMLGVHETKVIERKVFSTTITTIFSTAEY